MTIRKRDDSYGYKRGARGVSGTKDDGFSREYSQNPWSPNMSKSGGMSGDTINPKGAGAYTSDDDAPLRQVPDYGLGTVEALEGDDIWNAVEGQSSDDTNRAVRSKGQP